MLQSPIGPAEQVAGGELGATHRYPQFVAQLALRFDEPFVLRVSYEVIVQLFEPKTNPNRFLKRIDAPGVKH